MWPCFILYLQFCKLHNMCVLTVSVQILQMWNNLDMDKQNSPVYDCSLLICDESVNVDWVSDETFVSYCAIYLQGMCYNPNLICYIIWLLAKQCIVCHRKLLSWHKVFILIVWSLVFIKR